jgi:hypothetical protein
VRHASIAIGKYGYGALRILRTHGPRVRWIRDEDVVMIAVALIAVVVVLVLLLFAGYIGAGLGDGSR